MAFLCKYLPGVFAFVILGLNFHNTTAQTSLDKKYKFRLLTVENGLSNNRVTDVAKCSKGYIWIATDDGLNRFDGINAKYYEANVGKKDLDKYNRLITSIFNDTKGNLWIGGYTLFSYNNRTDSITPFFPAKTTNQPIRIRCMAQSDSNTLWMGARQGLFSMDLTTKKVLFYPPTPGNNTKFEIWDISISAGKIWIVTEENGFYVFDIKSRLYSKLPFPEDNIKYLLTVYAAPDGRIWIGTKEDGLFTYNPGSKTLNRQNLIPESNRIRKIKNDSRGNLWIGTIDGLYLKRKTTNEIIRVAHENDPYSKISQNSVHNIFIDKQDIMWLCTFAGGVCYTDLNQKQFYHFIAGAEGNYLNNPLITSFAEDKNGNIYIATDSSGINFLNTKTWMFSIIPLRSQSPRKISIKAMAIDSKNNLWIGTHQDGVTMYNTDTKKTRYYNNKGEQGQSLQSKNINSIIVDKEDNVWVGSTKGVDKILPSGEVEKVYSDPTIHSLHMDQSGNIWDGVSDDSIFIFNQKTNNFQPFSKNFNVVSLSTIYCDSRKHLWIGQKSGLVCVDLKDSTFKHFGKEDGLPNNIIQSIIEDDDQNIWVATASGMAKCEKAVINPFSFLIKNFSSEDGLQSDYFNKNAVLKTRSGQLFFGGKNGFNMFHPDSIHDDAHIPELDFGKLEIANKTIEVNDVFDGEILLDKTLSSIDKLELSYKHKSIYIEFLALHYGNQRNIQYAYMLYPLHQDWQYTKAPRNFASFYSLPDGEYTLKVKAANSDGLWNNSPIQLKINIAPPFWKRSWVIISCIILIILLILTLVNYRIKSIEKQKVLLQKLVEERTLEISNKNKVLEEQGIQILEQTKELSNQRDNLEELNKMKDKLLSIIAHDIKNPFNAVLGFSEILLSKYKSLTEEKKFRYIELINQSSIKIYSLLENLLFWSRSQINVMPFKPEKTNMTELIGQNIKFLEADCWKKNITVKTNLNSPLWVNIDNNMMNVVVRNIMSNAIKFSNSDGNIHVSHHIENEYVKISIIDDGVGISAENLQKLFQIGHSIKRTGTAGEEGTGLGLLICKEFIEKHGGKISASSTPGQGSNFSFTIPIDN